MSLVRSDHEEARPGRGAARTPPLAGARWTWAGAISLAALVVVACGPPRVPPPPPGPTLAKPAALVPGDLDVVVRLDLQRMRSVIGEEATRELRSRVGGGKVDPGGAQVVGDAISQANTAWFAFRPGLPPELTDNVLVLRGDFEGLTIDGSLANPKWENERDLGGGWRRFSRSAPLRSAPARIYQQHDTLIAFVSEAEIDGVELVIERGAKVDRVRAPSRGAFSVAARAPTLARLVYHRAPAAARLLDRARTVSGYADFPAEGLRAELDVEFRDEATAQRAADATRLLGAALEEQGGIEAAVYNRLDLEVVGPSVVLRLELSARDIAIAQALLK